MAVGANLVWLLDWVDYWWIRLPDCVESCTTSLSWSYQGTCSLGGVLTGCLLGTAVLGIVLWHCTGQKPTAHIIGLGLIGLCALALPGLSWEPLARLRSAGLFIPALFFAIPAAARGLPALFAGLHRGLGSAGVALVALGLPALGCYAVPGQVQAWLHSLVHVEPLRIGLDARQASLASELSRLTTKQARILWEDRPSQPTVPHWTPLLPLLTERSFLGGLDPQANIEHAAGGLLDQSLAGRPVAEWDDAQLADYCERYNVGWVMTWSEASSARLAAWPAAELLQQFSLDDGNGQLFRIRRQHSYALTGSAQWLLADVQRVVLGDVIPYKGRVVLSLHYQTGMRVTPGRIQLEADQTSPDAIPLVRLLLDDPAARVTITWQKR